MSAGNSRRIPARSRGPVPPITTAGQHGVEAPAGVSALLRLSRDGCHPSGSASLRALKSISSAFE